MHIKPAELNEVIQDDSDELVLHVFDAKAFESELIPHSISLPAKNIELLQELVHDKERPLIVYDQAGASDNLAIACNKLQQMGYSHISILDGGLDAWKEAGFNLHGKKHVTD